MSPLQVYQARIEQGEIKQDLLQNEVVLSFENLYQQLSRPKTNWFFKRKPVFHGLYIYGCVGRGKTFLMDLFVQTIKPDSIRRQHFHAFMSWFHQQRQQIKNQQDPIDLVIKKLATNVSVLCLDEFLVHDITDAMILSKILLALEKYGVSLVTTSNINPADLYQSGLQRKKFLPAIAWMQKNMQILQLDGNYDYRGSHLGDDSKWFTPINTNSQNLFEVSFNQLVGSKQLHLSPIVINKRSMDVIKRTDVHIMIEFDTLCKQPRNASDYMQLCQQYQSLFMVIDA
ncbi:MAG TPA: cell division protein ZapE, partial [Oceanospirillales bacterium]|nr:cell division protein ZapE [Oceanospirillales bacterium]